MKEKFSREVERCQGSMEGLIFHSLTWGVGRKKDDDYFLQKAQSSTPNGSRDSPGRLRLGSLFGQRNFPNVQAKSSFCGRFRAGTLKAGVLSHSSQTGCACLLLTQSVDHTCLENKVCQKGSFQETGGHPNGVLGQRQRCGQG